MRSYLILLFAVFLTNISYSQLEAYGDTTICRGGSAHLGATGGGVAYNWTSFPTDPSLLIPQQQFPVVSPSVSTMYVVQSNIATGNLILNGSFELGVMGFSSQYVNNQVSIVDEGTYAVVNDAHTVHPNFYCNEDHTTGSGKFMAVNGAGVANVKVWYLTLTNVQPEARYEFSTWITSLHPTNPAILQFSINGVLMGSPFQAYPYTCDWYQFFHIWDADTNHQATISIVNQNTILSGNDFALDDISFATVLVYYDTVYVEVLPQFDSPFDVPVSACTQEVINIEYTGNAPDTADFHWDFGGATVISGSGPGPYQIALNSIGDNTVSLYVDGPGCSSDTTFHTVTTGESPVVTTTADDLILPYGSSTTLHGSWSGGVGPYQFEWNHPELLLDPSSPDPQTVALLSTTTFVLAVTDQAGGCTGYDTVIVQVAGGPLGVNVTADPDEICLGGQTILSAQGFGGTENYTYAWTSNPPGFSSTLQTVTVLPTTTTQYTVAINDGLSTISGSITITVHPNPVSNAGDDIIIPYGTNTTLTGSGSGGSNYTYSWEPADMVEDPFSSVTPTVNLESTTIFTLTITDQATGCISEPDEVVVQINGGPLAVLVSSDKPAVCSGETAVLTAYPSGGNQGNYTYSWTSNPPGFTSDQQIISVQPITNTQYTVAVFDGFNTTLGSKELDVYPSTEFDWYNGVSLINACPSETVLLRPDRQEPGWSYLWSNGSVESEINVGVTGIGFSLETYTLTTTNPEGCSYSRSIQVIFDFANCSGLDENQAGHSLRILPNPGKGKFRIEWNGKAGFEQIEIISPVTGNILKHDVKGLSSFETRLENYPPGIYIVHLKGLTKTESGKLIILPQ